MLAMNPRFSGSNPAEDNGFFNAINIHSMTSFRGEVKPLAPSCTVL
jgi:hypothetical protein